jgi:hypothetical protein
MHSNTVFLEIFDNCTVGLTVSLKKFESRNLFSNLGLSLKKFEALAVVCSAVKRIRTAVFSVSGKYQGVSGCSKLTSTTN